MGEGDYLITGLFNILDYILVCAVHPIKVASKGGVPIWKVSWPLANMEILACLYSQERWSTLSDNPCAGVLDCRLWKPGKVESTGLYPNNKILKLFEHHVSWLKSIKTLLGEKIVIHHLQRRYAEAGYILLLVEALQRDQTSLVNTGKIQYWAAKLQITHLVVPWEEGNDSQAIYNYRISPYSESSAGIEQFTQLIYRINLKAISSRVFNVKLDLNCAWCIVYGCTLCTSLNIFQEDQLDIFKSRIDTPSSIHLHSGLLTWYYQPKC